MAEPATFELLLGEVSEGAAEAPSDD